MSTDPVGIDSQPRCLSQNIKPQYPTRCAGSNRERCVDAGYKGILVPSENAGEAAVVDEIDVIPISTLTEAVGFFAGTLEIDPHPSQLKALFEEFSNYDLDYADVRGQDVAKRALTISAAGAHNLLMLGPPGSGETEDMPKTHSDEAATKKSPHLAVVDTAWWLEQKETEE